MSDNANFTYTTEPFHPNIKCIIFGILIMALYWFSACETNRNVYILIALFFIAYILMAWYDYMYECEQKLYSGHSGINAAFDSIFKPQEWDYNPPPEKHPDQRSVYNRYVYLFHLILVAPLLIYIGWYQNKTDPRLYSLLLILGIVAASYHALRFFETL